MHIKQNKQNKTQQTKIDPTSSSNDDEKIEEEVIPIFSELKYRFPNPYQYDHYILLETDKNIFGSYQHIKQLHIKIIPPHSKNFVSTPSNTYLTKLKQHQERQRELEKQQQQKEKTTQLLDTEHVDNINIHQASIDFEHDDDDDNDNDNINDNNDDEKEMNFKLLNSAKERQYASRPPITKVETNIYSRSIFSYFDNYFEKIDKLIIEFNPYIFTSTFLTFNIPRILSKIKKLSLIKVLPNNLRGTDLISSKDIYCHECVSLLQYTRNLKELIFNFPLSSDFYPIINNLESLKIMHRIEQPFMNQYPPINNNNSNVKSAYAQNIVTINNNLTTMISNVKLQKSLIQYFSPSIKSLHLHGSKGLQQLNLLTSTINGINSGLTGDEDLNLAVQNKHKVFFGLEELCMHCSDHIYQFIYRYMNVVPQLKRLQLIFGKNCNVRQFIQILNHFHSNCVLNYTYNPSKDSLLSYYYNYYFYYGYNLSNSAKQLRYINVITKKTKHSQNYQLLNGLKQFLKTNKNMTLLHIRLLIQYSFWCTSDLMNVIELFSKNNMIFGRDSMSYQIIMPLKRQYQQHAAFSSNSSSHQSSNNNVKNKIKDIKDDYKYKKNEKYASLNDNDNDNDDEQKININNKRMSYNGVIDKNSLKGIASYVTQKGVGKLRIIKSENGMRDEDIVIIEKLRIETESKEKYESYKEFLYGQDEEYRLNKKRNDKYFGDERQIYKEKIAEKLLNLNMNNNDNNNDDEKEENKKKKKNKEQMFIKDIVKNINDSKWINECYYVDLLK